jgi:hypothetical protein
MPTAQIPIIKGDKVGVETDYRDALPVNMYAIKRDILGAPGYMKNYPGLTQIGGGNGIDRGANYNERFVDQYRVSGNKLISVDLSGGTIDLGSIPGTKQAAMPYSFNTQAVIADGGMFLYSPTSGFAQITDTDLGQPIDGVWVDGYYFLTDGEFLYHTDINDESSIDPLKFATAEFMPDPSLGLAKTQDNKVMVFGRYSLEYFVDIASENFAFQRVETRAQKIGIVATHAKCEIGGSFYITGGRKNDAVSVHIIGIGSSEKISTREIDKVISKYTEPELADMRMEGRTENGTVFILVHLPGETLCFNTSIAKSFGKDSAWCILKTDVSGDNTYRAINGVFDARSVDWVYGDKINGTIGKLDETVSTHYDSIVEWELYTPFIRFEKFSLDQIELETIPGHTATDDATVAFSVTTDGLFYGKEWWAMYGAVQDYNQRFIKRRCGYISDWVGFKFRGASRSRMAFSGLQVTYA